MSEAIFSGTRHWQQEQVFRSAEEYYQQLLEAINTARHSIVFNFYIFEFDNTGKRFCQALRDAAERGVDVKVVVDGIGSSQSCGELANYFANTRVAMRIFHPLPWLLESYRWSLRQGNVWNKFSHFFRRINRRDHRKLVIIDRSKLWTGSFNISDCHLPLSAGGEDWLDYGALVYGEDVEYLHEMFEQFWQQRKAPSNFGNLANFRVNFSSRIRRIRNLKLLRQIHQARQRIWICAAYFSPTGSVIKALQNAKRRGVDVRILTAGKSDVSFFPFLSETYFSDLLQARIVIAEYHQRILHAKAILIDDECIMGSSNLNHRSFYHDLEIDILLRQEVSIETIAAFLQQDMQQAETVSATGKRLWLGRGLLGWIPRLLRYWL